MVRYTERNPKKLLDKYVTITASGSQGSGCLIKPGYYLTALHILGEHPEDLPVIAVNNVRARIVSDLSKNRDLDLVVLSTFAEIDKRETQLDSYNKFEDNQDIILVGSPGDLIGLVQPGKIVGDVFDTTIQKVKVDSKMISAQYIESGISGGCVYSSDGLELLGVVTKKYGTNGSTGEATFVSKPIS